MLQNNFVSSLTGTVVEEPKEIYIPDKCQSLTIATARKSGYNDLVEIIIPCESRMTTTQVKIGDYVRVIGFIYTYENTRNEYPRVKLGLYATDMVKVSYNTNKNVIICQGTIVRTPVLRKTPAGLSVCDILLAVNNDINGVCASYVPVIAWNTRAELLSSCPVKTQLCVVGRLQSREYTKQIDGETKTFITKELSVNSFRILGEKDER